MKDYFGILRGQRHPVRFLLSRALMALGLSRRFIIDRDGYRLRFFPTPRTAELWIDRSAPRAEEPFVEAYLRTGDTVVDIGANIGEMALRFSRIVGESGRVVAVEAHPRIFSYLLGNIELNRAANVDCRNFAVARAPGAVRFSDRRWDELNAVVPDGDPGPALDVVAIRLDDLPGLPERIDLLKVDVEGGEKSVFEGAAQTLARTACVYFESNEEHYRRNGTSCREVFGLLRAAGFELYRGCGTTMPAAVEDSYSSPVNENIVAVRDRRTLRERAGYAVG